MYNSQGPIGNIDLTRPIFIYGAGISGLLLGYYLKKLGHVPIIYEKSDRAGGKIQTKKSPYGIYECAANAIFTNDEVYELLNELGLDYTYSTENLKKKVFRFGKVTSFPFRPFEILTILFKLLKKVPTKNIEQMSVYDFFQPLFGKKIINQVLGAALNGIYACAPTKLNFLSVFKQIPPSGITYFGYFKHLMASKKQASKSKGKSISFKHGMQEIVDALKINLKDNIKYNSSMELKSEVNNIVCTDSLDAAILLKKNYPQISNELEKINYTSLNTTTLFLNLKLPSLANSFGVVFGEGMNPILAGVLNNTAIFPNRASEKEVYSYTVISKNSHSPEEIRSEFIKIFNVKKDSFLDVGHVSWQRAIPLYDQVRADAILKIRTLALNHPNLVLFGNYTGSISIREIVKSSRDFAFELENNFLEKHFTNKADSTF